MRFKSQMFVIDMIGQFGSPLIQLSTISTFLTFFNVVEFFQMNIQIRNSGEFSFAKWTFGMLWRRQIVAVKSPIWRRRGWEFDFIIWIVFWPRKRWPFHGLCQFFAVSFAGHFDFWHDFLTLFSFWSKTETFAEKRRRARGPGFQNYWREIQICI